MSFFKIDLKAPVHSLPYLRTFKELLKGADLASIQNLIKITLARHASLRVKLRDNPEDPHLLSDLHIQEFKIQELFRAQEAHVGKLRGTTSFESQEQCSHRSLEEKPTECVPESNLDNIPGVITKPTKDSLDNCCETGRENKVVKSNFMAALHLVNKKQCKHIRKLEARRARKQSFATKVLVNKLCGVSLTKLPVITKNALETDMKVGDTNRDPVFTVDSQEKCAHCGQSGQLLVCDACSRVYHLYCLRPPLAMIPKGTWHCHMCKERKIMLK